MLYVSSNVGQGVAVCVGVAVLVGAPVGVRVAVPVLVGVRVGVPVGGTDTVFVMVGVSVIVGATLETEPATTQLPSNVNETEKKPSKPRLLGTPLKSARQVTRVPPPGKSTFAPEEVGGVLSLPG